MLKGFEKAITGIIDDHASPKAEPVQEAIAASTQALATDSKQR